MSFSPFPTPLNHTNDIIYALQELYQRASTSLDLDSQDHSIIRQGLCHLDKEVKCVALKVSRQLLALNLEKKVLSVRIDYILVK